MSKPFLSFVLATIFILSSSISSGAAEWAVKGDFAESCSCNPSCPCNFGSPATLGHCEGVGVVEIKEGHYGDVNLDGVAVVTTNRVGEWVKYSISDAATEEQAKAIEKLMPLLYPFQADVKVLSAKRVPVSVERTARSVKFSAPGSHVEIEMMSGANGKPIKIENLPADDPEATPMLDVVQYKSVTLSHSEGGNDFSYAGTNGYVGRVDTSGAN